MDLTNWRFCFDKDLLLLGSGKIWSFHAVLLKIGPTLSSSGLERYGDSDNDISLQTLYSHILNIPQ